MEMHSTIKFTLEEEEKKIITKCYGLLETILDEYSSTGYDDETTKVRTDKWVIDVPITKLFNLKDDIEAFLDVSEIEIKSKTSLE